MGLGSFFKNIFGKSKETTTPEPNAEVPQSNTTDFVDSVMEKASEAIQDVKETVGNVVDSASQKLDEMGISEKVSDFVNDAQDKLAEATDWVEDKAVQAKEKIVEVVDSASQKLDESGISEKVSDLADSASQKIKDAADWVGEKVDDVANSAKKKLEDNDVLPDAKETANRSNVNTHNNISVGGKE